LTALVNFSVESEHPPTTAAVLQAFAGTSHGELFASILGSLETEPMDDVAIEAEMREGLTRWWHQARLEGRPAPTSGVAPLPSAEGRRLEQLAYVHRIQQGGSGRPAVEPPDAHGPEGSAVI